MGIATILIGLIPETSTVWLAPTLLVIPRVAQGLAVGGQWGGAILLATEYAPAHRRGFYGSFPQLDIPLGLILGNGVFLIMTAVTSPEAFMAWG